MYQDVYVAKDWKFTEPMAVRAVYKLYTEQGYAASHRIIEPDKYIFFYTMEGAASFTVDDGQMMVGPNSLLIVNARRNLFYRCAGPKWNFWLVEFKTSHMVFLPNQVYPLTLGSPVLWLCEAALRDMKREHLRSAASLFQSLYYSCYHMLQKGTGPQTHRLLSSAELYMRENISRFSVAEMCACLNVEERTLRNVFMRELNTTPKKHFEFLRLEESKRCLENTSLSIAEIASHLGFSNPGHFSTAFRKEYGETPKQYRLTFSVSSEPDKR